MKDLFARFRKRKIGQWAVAYAAAAWIVIQVTDVLGDRWNWPLSLQRGLDVLLVVGFFVALVLAWYHGEKGQQKVTGSEMVILIGLLTIGGLVSYAAVDGSSDTGPPIGDGSQLARASIAVLPFAFEGASDWRWLADALAELVNTGLARAPDVRVLGTERRRTIMQRLGIAAENMRVSDARSIAEAAGAETLIVGRLQGDGEEIRVTGEILETRTGNSIGTIPTVEGAVEALPEIATRLTTRILATLAIAPEADATEASPAARQVPIDYYRYFLEGRDAALDRRTGEAIEKLEGAIAIDSTQVEPYYWLAWIYEDVGDRGAARRILARGKPYASELSEERRLEYLVMEAQVDDRWRDYAAHLERLLQLDPFDASDHFRYGFIQFHRFRNLTPGIAEMERAIALDSTYGWAFNSLGYAYLGVGDPQAAHAMMERYVALNPADLNPLDSRAEVAVLTGRYEQAIADVERVLAMEPGFSSSRLILARVYIARGQHARGLGELDRYDRMTPYPYLQARGRVLRSEIYLQRGDGRAALASADEALSMDSTNAEAHWQRGRSLIHLGRTGEARVELDELDRVLRPQGGLEGRWLIHHLEGELALLDSSFQEAISVFRKAVELGPLDRSFYLTALADAYRQADRLQDAITEYEAALAINPRHAFGLVGLGEAHFARGDLRNAESAYTRALDVWQDADQGIREHALATGRLQEIGSLDSGESDATRRPPRPRPAPG